MAAGDVYNQGITAVAQNGFFDIQPGSGAECVIHNISHSTDAELQFYDGSSYVVIDAQTGAGSWMGMFLHCTNGKFYRVKNTAAGSNSMCCDGISTK